MDQKDVIATLCKLQRMDQDAVQVYQDAIERTSDRQSKQQLQRFMADHRRHAQDIDEFVGSMGWQPTQATEEFEQLMQGFKMQVDMAEGGDDAVMLAMDLGERATNAEYSEALQMDIDQRVQDLLQRNFADEQAHLRFVESHIPAGVVSGGSGGGAQNAQGGGTYPTGSLQTATTGEGGIPSTSGTGGSGAYGGMGGDVGPAGGGSGAATETPSRDTGRGDVTADYGAGRGRRGTGNVPAAGRAAQESELSSPAGGLNADVRKGKESKGSEFAGGGSGAEEGHPNMGGQVEGDGGSSGSGVAGSGGSE